MKRRSKTEAPAASLVVMFSQNCRFEQPLLGIVTVWNRVPVVLFTPLKTAYAIPLCGNDPVLRLTWPLNVHGAVPLSNPGLTIVFVHPPQCRPVTRRNLIPQSSLSRFWKARKCLRQQSSSLCRYQNHSRRM